MCVRSRSIYAAWASLILTGIACAPIVTIGWFELAIISVFGVIILLPFAFLLLRGLRSVENRNPKE
jgi:hypothetical protein